MATAEQKMTRRRLANAYLSTVISISLVLLLVGVACLLLVNAKGVSDYFKENMRIAVLLKQEVTESEAIDYQRALEAEPYIRSTEYVSREQGIREMAELLGEDFLNVFEAAPVPISVEVTLKADYVSPDSLARVTSLLSASPLVDEVSYQMSLVEALNANLKKISLILGVFLLLLLFISFVLINNTVRLSVFSRRFTVHTMKLVGATRGFIRGPFLVQAVFQGLFAAILAIAMLLGILYFVRNEFAQLFEIFHIEQLLWVMGIIVVTGVTICLVSTCFVVNRLVALKKDELYA